MRKVLVELCAGTAAVSLRALGGAAAPGPLCGFMGSKRRWAGLLTDLLGFANTRPDHVVLVDAGPWGDTWKTLSTAIGRRDVQAHLESWAELGMDAGELWLHLVQQPLGADSRIRAAQYLWLQSRAASSIPIWWGGDRAGWITPSGGKSGGICSAGARQMTSGLASPRTLARRVRRLDALDWSRITVVHGRVEDFKPVRGSVVYFDPPYHRAPRYAELLPRASVIDVAERHRAMGCRVLISEAEPLPLEGWHHARLPGTDCEALTGSWPLEVTRSEQTNLFAMAEAS